MSRYSESSYSGSSVSRGADTDWYNEMQASNLRRAYVGEAQRSDQIDILPEGRVDLAPELVIARKALLSKLIDNDSHITNRAVACMLQTTKDKEYSGRNHERGSEEYSSVFIHAETSALVGMLEDDERAGHISRIIMAGTGQLKEKEIAPCRSCYEALRPSLSSHVELVLLQPDYFRRAVVLGGEAINRAYGSRQPLQIEGGKTEKETAKELEVKTVLNEEDALLISRLRGFMIEREIELYLTGSASGRGGISQEIHRAQGKRYTDIDLIAVTDKYEGAHQLVDSINQERSGGENRSIRCREPGTALIRRHYLLGEEGVGLGGADLDLIVAPTLEEGMLDKGYYRNNWYVKVTP